MNINTAVGEIRRYYLNLPKDDLTEGGKFTGEILEKLLDTYRIKVLEDIGDRLDRICLDESDDYEQGYADGIRDIKYIICKLIKGKNETN